MSVQISETRCVDVTKTTMESVSVYARGTTVDTLEMLDQSRAYRVGRSGVAVKWEGNSDEEGRLTRTFQRLDCKSSASEEGDKLRHLHG